MRIYQFIWKVAGRRFRAGFRRPWPPERVDWRCDSNNSACISGRIYRGRGCCGRARGHGGWADWWADWWAALCRIVQNVAHFRRYGLVRVGRRRWGKLSWEPVEGRRPCRLLLRAARRRSDGEADLSSKISLRTAMAFSARAAAWSCQNMERSRAANSSSRAKAG